MNISRHRVEVGFGGSVDFDVDDLFSEEELESIVGTQFMVFPFNEGAVQLVAIAHMLSEEEQANAGLSIMDQIDDSGL